MNGAEKGESGGMSRPTVNLLIDALACAAFVLLAATGFVLHFVLPPGSGRLEGGPGCGAAQRRVSRGELQRERSTGRKP